MLIEYDGPEEPTGPAIEEQAEDIQSDVEEQYEDTEDGIQDGAQDEPTAGGDEYTDEDPDGIEEQEPQEPEADDDGGTAIPIVYTDDNGEEVQVDLDYEELVDLVRNKDAAPPQQEIAPEYKAALQISEQIKSDELLKTVLAWRSSGYSEAQIAEGLHTHYNGQKQQQAQTAETPDFATSEEEIQYHVKKQLEEILAPLKNQVQGTQAQMQAQQVTQNNDFVIADSLKKNGWNPRLSQAEIAKLSEAAKQIYPDHDLTTRQLTQYQANVIVQQGLGRRKSTKKTKIKPPQAKRVRKQAGVPNIMPGNTARGKKSLAGDIEHRKLDGVSRSERRARLGGILPPTT